jgi:hypothetical protein
VPEILVVMLISSILTLTLWLGYEFIIKRYQDYKRVNLEYQNLMFLDNLLRRDFFNSRQISTSQERRFHFVFKNGETITYIFESDQVLRSVNEQTERFNLQIDNKVVEYLYLNHQITSCLAALKFRVLLRGRHVCLSYYKEYDIGTKNKLN